MRLDLCCGTSAKASLPLLRLVESFTLGKDRAAAIRQGKGTDSRKQPCFLPIERPGAISEKLLLSDGQRGADGSADDGSKGCPLGKAQLFTQEEETGKGSKGRL